MADLDGGQLLDEVENIWPKLGVLLRSKLIPAINQLGSAQGVAPVGETSPPSSPQAVSVATAGEIMHVSISDNQPVSRNVRYFTEVANNPAFSQPIVIDHGASRTSHPFPLPTMDGSGNKQNWYVRSYSQYQGSQPSKPVVYGGTQPIAVNMTGSTQLSLLSSTGSGTADNNGQQGGSGLGKVLQRPLSGPKRNVGSGS